MMGTEAGGKSASNFLLGLHQKTKGVFEVSDTAYKLAMASIAGYLAMIIVCFGPATVQSEKARAEYQAQCRAEWAHDSEAVRRCQIGGPSVTDGAPKALFWPLWLSYTLASR
jgi:hypothetical protein